MKFLSYVKGIITPSPIPPSVLNELGDKPSPIKWEGDHGYFTARGVDYRMSVEDDRIDGKVWCAIEFSRWSEETNTWVYDLSYEYSSVFAVMATVLNGFKTKCKKCDYIYFRANRSDSTRLSLYRKLCSKHIKNHFIIRLSNEELFICSNKHKFTDEFISNVKASRLKIKLDDIKNKL